ncbi:MAG TPA: tyrosine-type recombinase/integrase [Terriglobia bacterium]|nr:tyrosine-type recombinase/integrase [Terriglobia bacterium]
MVHPSDPWPLAAKTEAPEAPSLKTFADRFLEYVRKECKTTTAQFYENCLKRTLPFFPLAEIPMSAVTGELIGKYASFRQSLPSGNSVAALNGEMRILRRCFRLAEEWGLIPKACKVHELPGSKNRDRVIDFDEERTYLAAASPTAHDVATLVADTGLRHQSELFTLRWENVSLGPSAGCPNGFIHIPSGKTDNAQRNIPLTLRARAILERRRSAKVLSLCVFPGKGRCGHIVTVQHAHEIAVRKAGLEPFEFYCWRHTCGTRWAESGMDKFTIARLMGHSSPSVAEKYYIHVTESHVASGFERFLGYLDQHLADAANETAAAVSGGTSLKNGGTIGGTVSKKLALSR